MIRVNEKKCIKCYKCVNVCPFTVLGKENGIPQIREGKKCIECMHCAAACPADAVMFLGEPAILPQELPRISDTFFAENLEKHILKRRSYRHFRKEPVDRTVLEDALQLADWAPSAKNQHPHGWIVVDSKEVIDKIMECIVTYSKENGVSPEIVTELENENNNVVMGTAPTLILCYADNQAINAPADVAIAMTTVELMLQARGIGTCWGGYLTRMCNAVQEIKDLLPEIPEGHSFYGSFMVGYPEKEEYLHLPKRIKRAKIQWI